LQIRTQLLEIDLFELVKDPVDRTLGLFQSGRQGWDFRIFVIAICALDKIDRGAWKSIPT
jgi:hypothetical protein